MLNRLIVLTQENPSSPSRTAALCSGVSGVKEGERQGIERRGEGREGKEVDRGRLSALHHTGSGLGENKVRGRKKGA